MQGCGGGRLCLPVISRLLWKNRQFRALSMPGKQRLREDRPRLERGDAGSRGGCSHGAGDGNVALPPRHRLSRAELSAQVNVVQAGQGCPRVPSGSRSGREAKFFSERKGRGRS